MTGSYNAPTKNIITAGQKVARDWEDNPDFFINLIITKQEFKSILRKAIDNSDRVKEILNERTTCLNKYRQERDNQIIQARQKYSASQENIDQEVQNIKDHQQKAITELSRVVKAIRYHTKSQALSGDNPDDNLAGGRI